MKITIIGTGYVGLTEGLCFADLGHDVVCFDIVKDKIEQLKNGIPTLYEDNLEEMLKRNLASNKIKFTSDLDDALKDAEVVFICVNTPENPKDGSADLSAIMSSTQAVADSIDKNRDFVLVIRSTVPVGTNFMVKHNILKHHMDIKFSIASNPEFSRQGSAIKDFLNPDRIVVGVEDEKAKKVMADVYKPLTDKGFPLLFTTIPTAELIKYASNSFLAVKITFINEIADICEKTGADVAEVAKAMGMDKRISPYFLNAGPGIGGSCFPKDSIALVKIGNNLGLEMEMLHAAVESNKKRKKKMADRIIEASSYSLKGKKIALLGLTFKANTDDTRYSPSISIIRQLVKKNIYINAYDPKGIENIKAKIEEKYLKKVNFFDNPYSAVKDAEILVIATEWDEFRNLDYNKIYKELQQKTIIDLRNILNADEMRKIGYKYIPIGK